MVTEVYLGEAPQMHVSPVYIGHAWGNDDFILQQFEDDGTTPINYTSTYTLRIYRDNTRRDKMFEKSLPVSGNSMPVGQTKTENRFAAPGNYYFDIYDDNALSTRPFVRGTLTVIS